MLHPRLIQLRPRAPVAFATLAVLWTIAIVALVLAVLQAVSFREAAAGREALARVRAYWAARAGVEAQIAKLTVNTLSPDPNSAFTITTDLASLASGTLEGASWSVSHVEQGKPVDGAADAHAKLNVNTLDAEELIALDGMDETTAAAIVAWIRGDTAATDPTTAATDTGAYLTLRYPYKPRGAPVRTLKELELITGVTPQNLRGEDWNLNGRLDGNENDAEFSLPTDNADGKLDAGWSEYLTPSSELGGMALSGKTRIDLSTAAEADIVSRLKVDSAQARVINQHAQSGDLSDFVSTPLANLSTSGQTGSGILAPQQGVQNLSRDQLKTLLDESIIGNASSALPRSGRININTVARETLERFPRITTEVADALIQARQGRAGGFVSLTDLLDVPGIDNATLADLMQSLDVRSNVYIATSRGRDGATGIEVEIVAELDRSTIPVVIKDLTLR